MNDATCKVRTSDRNHQERQKQK